MTKILSQAGDSLADMYDVEGSVAGIDQLETRELPIVHEMGATIFSERFRTASRRVQSGAIIQSTDIDLEINNLPSSITRLLGIQVLTDTVARIESCVCSLYGDVPDQDFPVWVWDGESHVGRVLDAGAIITDDILLPDPGSVMLPTFAGGRDQGPDQTNDFRVRARTTAFGAGTVYILCIIYLAFTWTGGVSARGAAVPSW